MSKVRVKFDTEVESINSKLFEFEPSLKIRDMLKIFLSKTQSRNELSLSLIEFVYNGKILNSPLFLDKYLKDIFRFNNNINVRVMESEKIIGGKMLSY